MISKRRKRREGEDRGSTRPSERQERENLGDETNKMEKKVKQEKNHKL